MKQKRTQMCQNRNVSLSKSLEHEVQFSVKKKITISSLSLRSIQKTKLSEQFKVVQTKTNFSQNIVTMVCVSVCVCVNVCRCHFLPSHLTMTVIGKDTNTFLLLTRFSLNR